jgi:hypothetical protein
VAASALLEIPRATPETIAKVWDSLLRSRTLVLDEMAFRNRAVAEEGDSEAVRLSLELAAGRRRLANLLVAGPGGDLPERYRATVARTRAETERVERALAERSAAFRSELERGRIGFTDVAPAVPRGCALVFTPPRGYANRAHLAPVLPDSGASRRWSVWTRRRDRRSHPPMAGDEQQRAGRARRSRGAREPRRAPP